MINSNPDIIKDKNSNGDTILNIIQDIILFINDTIKTYEYPISDYNNLNNEIIIGKKHISDLNELHMWIEGLLITAL
jgi:hypothetical protein